jgi:hypothetical protein
MHTAQCLVMMAPKAALHAGETGLLLAKGDDKLLLKANTFQELMAWGSALYFSIAMANGGEV